jgi:hypothetical protein
MMFLCFPSLVITPEKFDRERHGQQVKSGGKNRRFVLSAAHSTVKMATKYPW